MDVVTDWVNGSNMIINGHLIWGGLMVALPFLPTSIVLVWAAFQAITDKEDRSLGLFLLIFCLPLAAVCTPIYMGYVLFAALLRLYNPLIKDEERILGGRLKGEFIKWVPALFRMAEMVGEACPQALLGETPFILF